MNLEEIYQENERHHQEIKSLIGELDNRLMNIPIKLKDIDPKPVLFNRNEFHQDTYNRLHWHGIGGKFFKIALFGFYIMTIINLILQIIRK